MMDMRHCAILLKCPIGSQDVIFVFESHWKHFSNVLGMIDCSFIKNDDWWHSLGTYSKPNHHFLRKFSFLLYATPFISFDSADCPYTIILGVVNPIYVEQFLVLEQNLHCVLFSKTCSYPIRKFFSFLFMFVG